MAARTAGMCAAVAVLVVFDYVDVRPALGWLTHDSRPSMVFLWIVVVGVIVLGTARVSRRLRVLPPIALAVGLVMLIPPLVRYSDAHGQEVYPSADRIPTGPVRAKLKQRPPPNVYLFLLDAYARPDRMREQFGFDDGSFLRALRSRGFVIPPETRAAYPMTLRSVPTILNMGYKVNPETSEYVMAGRNRVVATFRQLGYGFALGPIGLEGFGCKGYEDVCIPPVKTYAARVGMSDLTWVTLERTPGVDLMQTVYPPQVGPFASKRQFPARIARMVLAEPHDQPMFVYGHTLLTHRPYPYQGPGCRLQPGEPEGAAAYIGAVKCANASVRSAVRMITRKDPRAVIALASDHGTDVASAGVGVKLGTRDARRRLSNFVALRLPQRCRSHVPRDLPTVNIFRVVMNCVTTARLPLLPYRAIPY